MGQKNYMKLLWLFGFIAFAAVSCWATAESLHLLLPSWPAVMCWIVTVGFFIIASLGTKMIVDSLNQNIYLERRGLRLLGGIIILLVFWLVCSMPTNTHTFFYRSVINDKITTDISTTNNYLAQIENNTSKKKRAEAEVKELRNKVDILLGELEAEIKNEANPGFGTKSKEILRKFATLLSVDKIDPLTYRGSSKQDRDKLCDAYRKKMYILADSKAENITAHISMPDARSREEAAAMGKDLTLVKKQIDEEKIDVNDANEIKGVCDKLNQGYNTVKQNAEFVSFNSKADAKNYKADNPITKVKRMISVFDVWEDFIKGEYAGHGFAFWIVISILVDVAAFIFFDLAFKKRED